MSYAHLLVEHEGPWATVTINRPQVLNALNRQVLDELRRVIADLQEAKVRVVIITGAGDRAFVAGADIHEMKDMDAKEAHRFAEAGQAAFSQIAQSSLVSIAAINGFALGGGCELAMACDIRVASEKARLGQPEVNLGVIPGFAGTQRLPRLVGPGRAKLLTLTGDIIDAAAAERMGLVDLVVPPDQLLERTRELARKLAAKGPLAIIAAKRAIDAGLDLSLEAGSAAEAGKFAALFDTTDQKEGMAAYLGKRPAQFQGK
ncbi:MAG TPA: crotonase [Clostridiales bacterium UBA8153]|nr:crotonase [Clostridiales bacterium UBA8153]